MFIWRKGNIEKKTVSVLQDCVYYYNGAQRYEQFLQVRRLYRALILLGLALSSERLHGAIYVVIFFCLHPIYYLLVSWAWWNWPLTWLSFSAMTLLVRSLTELLYQYRADKNLIQSFTNFWVLLLNIFRKLLLITNSKDCTVTEIS